MATASHLIENNNDETTCLFCLEDLSEDNQGNLSQNKLCSCNYFYHQNCLDKFVIAEVYNCPLCRKSFRIQNNRILLQEINSICHNIRNLFIYVVTSASLIFIIFVIYILRRFIFA